MYEHGKQILEDQPFSMLIGARLNVFEEGKAELALPISEKIKQQHGFVHGGVISYMADNTLTYAGGSVLGNVLTSEFKINFVRPATGTELIARAKVFSAGRSQAVCGCEVYVTSDDAEKLVAVAQGTIVKV